MDRRSFLCLSGVMTAGFLLGPGAWLSPAEAARGSSREESAKAREIFERLGATKGKPQHKLLQGSGTYTLPPGEVVTFDVRGQCLDHQFSAPSQNEPLAFRPMTQYIDPELRELYRRVMRNSGSAKSQNVDVQKIIWAMRSPATASWTEGLSSKEKNYLNSVMPGGAALLQRAQRSPGYLSGGSGGSGGGNGGGGADALLGALLPQLARQLPFNVQQHSNELMRQLQNRRAQKPMPDSSSRYSMLTSSGVAGTGYSLGGLLVRGSVANDSPEPFHFDPTQWVLESARDVQAVALPPMTKISLQKGLPTEDERPQPKSDAKPDSQQSPQEKQGTEEQFNTFTNDPN